MAIKSAAEISTGSFFKPETHANAAAILFIPKSIKKDVPNTYQGKTTERDEITAEVYIWTTQDQVDGKAEPEHFKSMVVHHGALTNALEPVMAETDGAVVGVVRKVPPQSGGNPYWAIKSGDKTAEDAAVAFFEKLTAAKAEAVASMPSFD
jgi:hypothetical protein